MFFRTTRRMLDESDWEDFVFIRFDVDRFQLINSFYSTEEGDRLLQYMADLLRKSFFGRSNCTFGRIEADIFACCVGYSTKEHVMHILERVQNEIKQYNRAFDIVPIFGAYFLDDRSLPVDVMLDRATLAAKTCKGNYVKTIAVYSPDLSLQLKREQEIINEMTAALAGGQFVPYFQPKYNVATGESCGAEALVRWLHPTRGMLSPAEFIPVLEKNGFISRLDYNIWEQVCCLLRKWQDAGLNPNPVSVNVSRVNLYNPQLVDLICGLTKKYGIPNRLLQLELTESAYMDNPQTMKQLVRRLRSCGFTILMDDFGSAYSSLSILKDVEVDVLKIDMGFLAQSEIPGRGENIIASIVRMAKWLSIPAIAEGAETAAQVEFLRSIGCEQVQGFHFARPMPVAEYEKLSQGSLLPQEPESAGFDLDGLWDSNPQMNMLFSNATQATAIYEFEKDRVEILRVNKAFYNLLGYGALTREQVPITSLMDDSRKTVLDAFRSCVSTHALTRCQFQRELPNGRLVWMDFQLQYVAQVGEKHILCGSLADITLQKEMSEELEKYKNAISGSTGATNRILIVDDSALERDILRDIFQSRFSLLEAADGEEAMEVLKQNEYQVDAILLDLVMPKMDGVAFLKKKQSLPEMRDIPVIIITAVSEPEQQIRTLALGISDYIVKPFIGEVVLRHVQNVLESKGRLREILQEYRSVVEQAQSDPLTQLLNRTAAEQQINDLLSKSGAETQHALLMMDLDNFKETNDTFGHSFGDLSLVAFSKKLKQFFRKNDVIARFGGDEFCVFLDNIPSEGFVLEKAMRFCREVSGLEIGHAKKHLGCSVGVAMSSSQDRCFSALYKKADLAMYESKRNGKNLATLYGHDTLIPSREPHMNKSWLLGALDTAVFLFDNSTYELLYASRAAKELLHSPDCIGKKCYEVLFGRTAPCEQCIRNRINPQGYYRWVCHNPYLKKKLYMKDKLTEFEGREVRLQVIAEIPPNLRVEEYMESDGSQPDPDAKGPAARQSDTESKQ